MDEFSDILSVNDDLSKNFGSSINPLSSVYQSLQKNPFDRQFELAAKNNQNFSSSRYNYSISNFDPNSPLNTPSIFLNDSAAIIPNESITPTTTSQTSISNISEAESSKPVEDDKKDLPTKASDKRCNVVSVICTPVPTNRLTEKYNIKSAPIILQYDDDTNKSKNKVECKTSIVPLVDPKPLDNVSSSVVQEKLNQSQPPSSTDLCSVSSSSEATKSSLAYTSQVSFSNWIKILPKQNISADSSTSEVPWNLSSLSNIASKKKEKSVEELLNKIKATEAALPPKAKPGRKRRSSSEEDVKEKKRLSLERNRAAAMRCRLKKKKEIDELKTKVQKYEQQNQDLRTIIEGLCKEVCELKKEIMRHKDCS